MAEFNIVRQEGVTYVEARLKDESIRAEPGALCYMTGDVTLHSRLIPSIRGFLRSALSDEALYRPEYRGTGMVCLESSLGGFHIFEPGDDEWILEKGSYWASDGSVRLGVYREPMMTSFWAGAGFIDYRTDVRGPGQVVLCSQGPVEEYPLKNSRFVAEGTYVIARTARVKYKIRRATKSFFGRLTAGEGFVRQYEGTGRLLVSSVPYWRLRMMADRSNGAANPLQAAMS